MEVIQSLLEASDRTTYTQRLQQAAVKLGKSVRTVRRLIDKWEQEGLAGLTQTQRADKGKHRVNENWQEFILKTYKEGVMKAEDIQPWLFRVEPYEGESLSHFLGRFRQGNELKPTGLGKAA
ncbi:hypothetical protein A6S26_27530 [Nostoc sp. ATCC 43529]|nr:hypothetical protein A6S26_27530 [Nostoc sp. ATCC 43529]